MVVSNTCISHCCKRMIRFHSATEWAYNLFARHPSGDDHSRVIKSNPLRGYQIENR